MTTPAGHSTPNRLSAETSPYLLQHAHNPVDWHPWGETALQLAREQDKPILLSIGYSACHWCHVMAHESFEDPATADIMNRYFINIKVDREERPDLDKIYQSAHQLITQRSGGWPLTMFLTPQQQTPFFGGTYFPNENRYGMPAFRDLLHKIATLYQQRRADVEQQAGAITQALQQHSTPSTTTDALNAQPLQAARAQLEASFDDIQGGFGGAPKFPHLGSIECLFQQWTRHDADEKYAQMGLFTLQKIAQGGIYDHIGGGFCRYSVDELWMIPHFEKMLYDNGAFLGSLSHAWQLTESPLFQRAAQGTADWVLREMQAPEGGFYSSLDADSEGEEGLFYVWTPEQVKALLKPDTYQIFARHFGLNLSANFEQHWHLHSFRTREELVEKYQLALPVIDEHIDSARAVLFAEREKRVRPGRDDKLLTAWNALMIKGLAISGRVFERAEEIEAASRALDFVHQTLWRDGRLLATYKDGKAHLNAYLDDYAYLIDAILHLLQARWRDGDLNFAIELAEVLLEAFEDKEHGGFYFTAHDHETLIQRPKPFMDDAIPSGNGIAAQVLGRLGHLLGDTRYLKAAERTLQAAWSSIQQVPHAHDSLLLALLDHLYPPQTIVLRGTAEVLPAWQQACQKGYVPQRLTLAIPDHAQDLPGLLAERKAKENTVAYVCSGMQCSAPIEDLQSLRNALEAG